MNEQEIRKIFDQFDADKNGKLDKGELKQFMAFLNQELSDEDVRNTIFFTFCKRLIR